MYDPIDSVPPIVMNMGFGVPATTQSALLTSDNEPQHTHWPTQPMQARLQLNVNIWIKIQTVVFQPRSEEILFKTTGNFVDIGTAVQSVLS